VPVFFQGLKENTNAKNGAPCL